MKKIILGITACMCLTLTACGDTAPEPVKPGYSIDNNTAVMDDPTENGTDRAEPDRKEYMFTGTIQQINDKEILVSDTYVNTADLTDPDSLKDLRVGDTVVVAYDGIVEETYPTRIPNTYSITSVKSDIENEQSSSEQITVTDSKGSIVLTLPDGWEFREYHNEEENTGTAFGFELYHGDKENYITVGRCEQFGMCGTGLETRAGQYNGMNATACFYDGSDTWSAILFEPPYENYAVMCFADNKWMSENSAEMEELLDSLVFSDTV